MTLSPDTRSQLDALAAELTTTVPQLVDDPGWLTKALTASSRLPSDLSGKLRRFRRDPGRDALLVIHDLPLGPEPLPPTPGVLESVERKATFTSSTLALVALYLGELVAFRNEKAGALVQNVVPVQGQAAQQSNAGSTWLKMHVENAFHPHRPDFVMLLCLRSDHDSAAGLLVASIRRAARLLSPETKEVLSLPCFQTEPPPSFLGSGKVAEHPVLSGDLDDPDICVDFASTRPQNEAARAAMDNLGTACGSVAWELKLRPGDLAIIDNRLAVHGRTAFAPRYDGHDRWLQRVFVQIDCRRSRGRRPHNGCVLE